jgi:hypothetical protein
MANNQHPINNHINITEATKYLNTNNLYPHIQIYSRISDT